MRKRKNVKFVIYVKLKFLRQFLNNILKYANPKQICIEFVQKKYNKKM